MQTFFSSNMCFFFPNWPFFIVAVDNENSFYFLLGGLYRGSCLRVMCSTAESDMTFIQYKSSC